MPNRPERYTAHCRYCYVELEGKSAFEAIERAEEHEKTCSEIPSPKALARGDAPGLRTTPK